MNKISTIIGIWQEGLLSKEDVVRWADEQILECEHPDESLIELSLKGPFECSKKPSYEFPAVRLFSFTERFALRAANLNLDDPAETDEFIQWLTISCAGESLELPEALLGYQIDHYAWDCDDRPRAVRHLQEEMAILLPTCIEFVSSLESECLTNQSTTRLWRRTQQSCAGY